MGFQGQLSSVNIADIFQTLHVNRQVGTLSVFAPGQEPIHVYFDQGQIGMASAPAVNGLPYLLHHMSRRSQMHPEAAADLGARLRAGTQPLRQLLLATGAIAEPQLDEVSSWCIEELVCPIFEWNEGDFQFTDGAPVDELMVADVVEMGRTKVPTPALVLEATRRRDEWQRIREVITDATALFVVDNDGRAALRSIPTDPEMIKVLRYLDGRHELDQIAELTGLTRFDTWAIVAQVVQAGVARPSTPQDIVHDAAQLRAAGDLAKARDLLEAAVAQTRLPEVMRPLAELCAQLQQVSRSVELYLELIQIDQDRGELDQALLDLDTVIGFSPEDPELHFERAQILAELGRVEESAEAYVRAAQTYLGTRDVSRAIDACHRAKNLLPRAPDPHRFLAKAYLLDGQTENAVVEYKALWHALLSTGRPNKALEELVALLDADCKFPAIKEQVLAHAQNSEAVKISRAKRITWYVGTGLLVCAGIVGAWEYWQQVVVTENGKRALAAIETGLPARLDNLEHPQVCAELQAIMERYHGNTHIYENTGRRYKEVSEDYQRRASAMLQQGDSLMLSGRLGEAEAIFRELGARYQGTKAGDSARPRLVEVREQRVRDEVETDLSDATRRWKSGDWDAGLAGLSRILERKDLPSTLRKEVGQLLSDWQAANRDAKQLLERAQRIESAGRSRDALAAYRRAIAGEGAEHVDLARQRLTDLELRIGASLCEDVRVAANRGDAGRTFALLDDLARLAAESSTEQVRDIHATFDIPYRLTVEHPRTVITVRRLLANGRASAPDQVYRAPAGSTPKSGAWVLNLGYRHNETLAIAASLTGFSPASITVNAGARSVGGTVPMSRGPRWRAELSAPAAVAPVLSDRFVLVASGRSTLDIIDPALGANRPVLLPETVAEFRQPPAVHGDHAVVALEDTLHCIDVNARTRLWQWPMGDGDRSVLTGHVTMVDHELIQGQRLVFAGARDRLLCLAASHAGKVQAYPALDCEAEITGTPLVHHPNPNMTVLWVTARNQLFAFDIGAITSLSPAKRLAVLRSKGDMGGRLARVTVGGKDCLLVAEATGLLLAVDLDPRVSDDRRVVASWNVDGTAPSSPVVAGTQAFVSVAEGRVMALNIASPGVLQWTWPIPGTPPFGALVGEPAVGRHGVYIASVNGMLACLDPLSGRERWRADLGSAAVGGIAARDGQVFVPVKTGLLLGFDEGEE